MYDLAPGCTHGYLVGVMLLNLLVFCVVFYLFFFCWPLHCLFFDIRLLIIVNIFTLFL